MLILIFHDVILSFSCSWYMHGFFCLKHNKDIIITIIIIIKLLITSYLANRMSRKITKKKLL